MTEQPPRNTIEKVRHHYSKLARSTDNGAANQALESIEATCQDALDTLLLYIPAGPELDHALMCHREAFLWFQHAVLVNPSDNSSQDGKLTVYERETYI